jgi:hypothetical protein
MTLTTCLSERFGEREGSAGSKHTSLCLGSRRIPHKAMRLEVFWAVQ